jgi:cytoskeleton protein RodZ
MVSTPFGEHLKREREMRGVSLEEISAATRISTRFLEALETEQWDHLPGGVFNRGFIRSVARFLGLDEESLIAEYALETKGRVDTGVVPDPPLDPPRQWGPALLAVAAVLGLLLAAWFIYAHFGERIAGHLHRKSAPATTAAATSPPSAAGNPIPQRPAAAAPAAQLDLKIDIAKPVTLKIVADGRTAFNGPIEPGQPQRLKAENSLEITTSDSGAVILELNGQAVPPIGLPGQPGSVTLTKRDLKSAAGGIH